VPPAFERPTAALPDDESAGEDGGDARIGAMKLPERPSGIAGLDGVDCKPAGAVCGCTGEPTRGDSPRLGVRGSGSGIDISR
jgi:hypothetical protein